MSNEARARIQQMLDEWGANTFIPVASADLRAVLAELDRILACNDQGDKLVTTLQAEIKLLRARRS